VGVIATGSLVAGIAKQLLKYQGRGSLQGLLQVRVLWGTLRRLGAVG
jgi:hypothetical protein